MKFFFLIIVMFANVPFLFTQNKTKLYIEKYSDLAVNEMIEYGIPASITLSQGILESGNGESRLAREANNHFGIKCHGWKGDEIYADDDQENECFRKYKTAKESFRDHSEFLIKNNRYRFLFDLELSNYKGWARGLKDAGYATSPTYADNLISIIERYQLQEFDLDRVTVKKNLISLSHSYGFPFVYGVGLYYFPTDKYFINLDVSSSFVFSGVSIGSQSKLFNNFYGGVDINGIYHGYTVDNTYKLDFGVTPKVSYLYDKKDRDIIIGLGALFFLKEIKNQSIIPSFSLTYLIN